MNLSNASKVIAVIDSTEPVEHDRSANRAKISKLINGFPPVDEAKAKKLGLDIVFNGGDAQNSFRAANLQFFNAFQSRNNYFTIQIPSAPVEKKLDWELQITEFINKPLKDSKAYSHMLDQQDASVVMHGIGPQYWFSKDAWCPTFRALKDLRVATDTDTSLDNMVWNAPLSRYTMGELSQRVFGKYAHKGWKKELVGKILEQYQPMNWEAADLGYSWATEPERFASLIKQNMIAYTSDAIPTINLWHFYHLDQANPMDRKVYMKVVPERGVKGADFTKFLFDSNEPVANSWEELIHVQFGDLNGDPPFKWHAVRSLGFMLHEPAFWLSLMRCRSFQHTWENFQMLLQGDNPPDKARGQKFELFKGWLPTNQRIVPSNERHQIDARLLEFNMAQAKQMVGESSSAYTQQSDNGTQKERTLGEVQAQLQTLNQVTGGIIGLAARQRRFSKMEICRRFCNKKSIDPDVRRFWKQCNQAGIPEQYINHKLWVIELDMPIGSGNQTLEIAKATQLMAVRGAHGPEAQELILHLHDAAVTGDSKLAQRLAPVGGRKGITDATRDAQAMFGSLMAGSDAKPREGLNPIDQIESLFKDSSDVVALIEQTGNMATMPQVAGLTNVATYIGLLLNQLMQDEAQKERTTLYAKALAKLNNDIKGFVQRIAEEMSKGEENGNGAKVQGEIQAMLLKAQVAGEIKKQSAHQKERMNQMKFAGDELRKSIALIGEMDRDKAVQTQELLFDRAKKVLELATAKDETTES